MAIKTQIIATAARRKAIRSRVVNKPKPPKEEGKEIAPQLSAYHIQPREVRNLKGGASGKTIMGRIREIMKERSLRIDPQTNMPYPNTRFDDVADAFVRQCERGNFQHLKEFIDRDDGPITKKIQLEGDAVKLYIDTPTEGPDAP